MVFRWHGDQLQNWSMTFGQPADGGYTVSGLLDALLGLKRQQIDGPHDLLENACPAIGSFAPGPMRPTS